MVKDTWFDFKMNLLDMVMGGGSSETNAKEKDSKNTNKY